MIDILFIGDLTKDDHQDKNTQVQNLWNDTEHPNAGPGPYTHDVATMGPPDPALQVQALPAVIFIQNQNASQTTVNRLEGSWTQGQLESAYQYALSGQYGDDDGNTPTPNQEAGLPIGLGILDISVPDWLPVLPPAVYGLLALIAVGAALRSKSMGAKIVYGVLAVICLAKLKKLQNQA